MLNSIGSWLGIVGLIVGPFSVGVLFEEKLQRAQPRTWFAAAAQILDTTAKASRSAAVGRTRSATRLRTSPLRIRPSSRPDP